MYIYIDIQVLPTYAHLRYGNKKQVLPNHIKFKCSIEYLSTYQHPKFTQKSCYTSQAQQSHPAGQTPTFRAILDHTDRLKESPESGQFVTWEGWFIIIPNSYDGKKNKIPCFETTNQ